MSKTIQKMGIGMLIVSFITVVFMTTAELTCRFLPIKANYAKWYAQSYTYLLDPTTGWKLEPRHYQEWGTVNVENYRGPLLPKIKAKDEFRILLLGGSAAYDMWKGDHETWAEQLRAMLAKNSRRHVTLLNAATPGFSTWQSYQLLITKMQLWQPDLILVFHLYNDSLTFRMQSIDEIKAAWQVNSIANYICSAAHPHPIWDYFTKIMPAATDLVRILYVQFKWTQVMSRHQQVWKRPDLEDTVNEQSFQFYLSNLQNIAKYAFENLGIRTVIITQPSLIHTNNSEAERNLIHYAYRGLNHDRLVKAYQHAWSANAKLAEKYSYINHIAAHQAIPPSLQYFFDEVHLNHLGSRQLANFLAVKIRSLKLGI